MMVYGDLSATGLPTHHFDLFNKHAFELFENGSWVFQNSLNPDPTVDIAAPWPPASFSGFQLWATFTPAVIRNEA